MKTFINWGCGNARAGGHAMATPIRFNKLLLEIREMIIQRTFLIFAFQLLTLISYGQKDTTGDKSKLTEDSMVVIKKIDITVYELAIPAPDKEGMFPTTRIEIKKNKAEPAFLKFKPGGTETNIRIIDSVYSRNYKNIWDTPPTKKLDFVHSENGLLDISDLAKGTYFVRYMSCNIGGNFILTLTN